MNYIILIATGIGVLATLAGTALGFAITWRCLRPHEPLGAPQVINAQELPLEPDDSEEQEDEEDEAQFRQELDEQIGDEL